MFDAVLARSGKQRPGQRRPTQARQRHEAIVKTFPAIPTSSETLMQVIDRYVALERTSATPDGLYPRDQPCPGGGAGCRTRAYRLEGGRRRQQARQRRTGAPPSRRAAIPRDSEAALCAWRADARRRHQRACGARRFRRVGRGAAKPTRSCRSTCCSARSTSIRASRCAAAICPPPTALPRTFSLRIMRKLAS